MRKFNFIFRELVTDNKDFIGLIAYTVYKRQKIAYLDDYYKKNERYPTEQELDQYHEFTSSPNQLQHYRNTAQQEVDELVDIVLKDKAEEIEAFYRDAIRMPVQEIKNEINQATEKGNHSFWYGVGQSFMGSLIWLLFLGLIVFISWSTEIGPKTVFERIIKYKLVPDSTTNR